MTRPWVKDPVDDHAAEYRTWHRSLPGYCYMLDVDCIEWRFVNGELVPKMVVELTSLPRGATTPYFEAITERYEEGGLQGAAVRYVARALQVPACTVAYEPGMPCVYIRDVGRRDASWRTLSVGELRAGLERL